ncbi:MAG: hemerythrin domain-containing protein [Deltaproteobacteria bacterium]|nr:hemerythrin domain-containing protein [Deltaproteobacteria bacterium]
MWDVHFTVIAWISSPGAFILQSGVMRKHELVGSLKCRLTADGYTKPILFCRFNEFGQMFAYLSAIHLIGNLLMKATDLLKKDRDTVKKLFAAFEEMGDKARPKRSSQAEEICEELRIHAAIEEEIFYPAVKSIRDKQAKFDVEEALQEHKQIKSAMDDILKIEGQEPA